MVWLREIGVAVEAPVAAIGKFDSLHLGHRALAAAAAELGRPFMLGFDGMAEVLGWQHRLPLTAPSCRGAVLRVWAETIGKPVGWRALPFTRVRDMAPTAFVDYLADELGLRGVVTGANFRFGRDRAGDAELLRSLGERAGMAVRILDHVEMDADRVSSSRVRARLAVGDVGDVAELLGRPYRLVGTVVEGDRRGRTIGFPTANCGHRENQAPCEGVYAAWAHLGPGCGGGPSIPAAVNVGHLPTIGGKPELRVEAHLMDWSGDCYGERLTIDFVQRIRGEVAFDGLAALTAQIEQDVAQIRTILGVAG